MFLSPKDAHETEQIKTIHESFTTGEKLHKMHHPWSTQVNKSLNMRLAELAPKHKHFSRSSTLQHRVSTVIGMHNLGYKDFYSAIFCLLEICNCPVLLKWSDERDVRKEKKKTYDNQLENKRRRAHKADAKIKADIYKERTQRPKDGDYKVSNDQEKEKNNNHPKWKRNQTPCDCGEGRVHT